MNLLDCCNISKRFDSTQALDNVSIAINRGLVHAILGENGAGKSTLLRIITGATQPDEGRLLLEGKEVHWRRPIESLQAGIGCVYQELSLIPDLSVLENLTQAIIAVDNRKHHIGVRRAAEAAAREGLLSAGLDLAISASPVRVLPLSVRQVIEIVKVTLQRPRLIILDEPTSALTNRQTKWFVDQVMEWKEEGIGIVFISHRMREIEMLADEMSVLREGKVTAGFKRNTFDSESAILAMSGRSVSVRFPKPAKGDRIGEVVLSCEQLSGRVYPTEVTFKLNEGELVGVGGLDGQGQRELMMSLYGACKAKGKIEINRQRIVHPSIKNMRKAGVFFVPADRQNEGLMQDGTINYNMTLPWLSSHYTVGGFVRGTELDKAERSVMYRLNLSTADLTRGVSELSGGNQQKVVFGKALIEKPRILLLYDITRGVDIRTKSDMYSLIVTMLEEKVAVIMYSTDNNELVGLSDRVLVMSRGRVVKELNRNELSEESLISASMEVGADVSTGYNS